MLGTRVKMYREKIVISDAITRRVNLGMVLFVDFPGTVIAQKVATVVSMPDHACVTIQFQPMVVYNVSYLHQQPRYNFIFILFVIILFAIIPKIPGVNGKFLLFPSPFRVHNSLCTIKSC